MVDLKGKGIFSKKMPKMMHPKKILFVRNGLIIIIIIIIIINHICIPSSYTQDSLPESI
jgi:hypothetical protein